MKKLIQRTLLLLLFPLSMQAQKVTVSGYIKDAKNGEGLIGASIFIKELLTGTTTNTYGFYSLTLPKGNYTLVATSVGYRKNIKTINLNDKSVELNIELQEDGQELAEVVVRAEKEDNNVKAVEMSVNRVEMKTIKKIPALLGEVDLVRAIQLLPGVTTAGEGASGFNVRGGGIDQNLILLDDAPVYNSSHLFGFFSVFNPDAVKDVKLIKGGIPAQYGGRGSSILDVKMKEGNAKQLEVNGGIGLIFSRLSIEAPIVKDKASFIVAARRSYIDILAKPFLTGSSAGSKFNFYDLTAKVNYNINQKNTVFLSGYFGRDVFGQDFGFNWGNSTLSARWNHVFSNKLFLNNTAFYSNYDYYLDSDLNNKRPNNSFKWRSNIVNYSYKPDFTYYISPDNTLTFGGQVLTYDFKPGEATATSEGVSRSFGQKSKNALELSAYIGNEWKVSPKLTLQYGIRYSSYSYSSQDSVSYQRKYVGISDSYTSGYDLITSPNTPGQTLQTYGNWEPRFSANLNLSDKSSIKVSYNRLAQYIHLLSNTAASTPLDVWTPSTNNIKPQIVDQVAFGFFKNYADNMFEASAEIYYKTLQNQIDYADGAQLFLNPKVEKDLMFGDGRAYGLELFVKKNRGKLTGWLSYTLQRSERQIAGLNKGEWYPNRYDRTNTVNLVAQYEFNKKWSFGTNFTYVTGVPYTLPEGKASYQGLPLSIINAGTRGNLRVPSYHRLDVSATKKNKKALFGKGESEWVFSIYNLYNRRNPFSIYTQQQDEVKRVTAEDAVKTQAVQFSVIGTFVPAVTYNMKF